MNNRLLIIFQKNPLPGKVKTRLAAEVGEMKALSIYKMLIRKTYEAIRDVSCTQWVFYNEFIDKSDIWDPKHYDKFLQSGKSLGEKMKNAFKKGFGSGYKKICIIGTDCYGLTANVVENAFEKLGDHDYVIGPAADGGYYLLGMKNLNQSLFENKQWSTDSVLKDTIYDIETNNQTCFLLPELTDIDQKDDLSVIDSNDLNT